VVDTTGAGDAFNGALAASMALKPERAFAEHVRFAGRYASRSTELYGAALAMPRMPVE
jgi:ribokinase